MAPKSSPKEGDGNPPSLSDINKARMTAGLSEAEAAGLVGMTSRSWNRWERGQRVMHPSVWELFQYRVGQKARANSILKKEDEMMDLSRLLNITEVKAFCDDGGTLSDPLPMLDGSISCRIIEVVNQADHFEAIAPDPALPWPIAFNVLAARLEMLNVETGHIRGVTDSVGRTVEINTVDSASSYFYNMVRLVRYFLEDTGRNQGTFLFQAMYRDGTFRIVYVNLQSQGGWRVQGSVSEAV